ncbi:MAG TPA: SIS domain-containing protein [Limnobacter sp.]|uniref:MurR/RpiR family transcriptional regulator n=1 Tax=Limnobacter sp. TaxID=2003368 RepID=UPI002E37B6CD|nr:SIS domain-containing protein [Limnobacter sp.]HEX5485112.1 SIS domain-containing protein [Limnobacter sp.]
MNVLDRITGQLDSLSRAEQAVARLVLHDPDAFLRAPVSEAASLARVSGPTVVRFCRSLGYEGLSDFKLKLASSLSRGSAFVHQSATPKDSDEALIHKVIGQTIHTLEQFKLHAPVESIAQASRQFVQSIRKKGTLVFMGVGNSGMVAQDAQHKFFRLGCHTQALSDGHLQIMQARMLSDKDTLCVISISGKSRVLIDACKLAQAQGAGVVVISQSRSPLARQADLFIAADHHESYEQFSPMSSRILHLSIVDILATKVALALGPKMQSHLAGLKDALIRTRYVK